VRTEEVIDGERTLNVEEPNSAEVTERMSTSLRKVVKLGHSPSLSQAETVNVQGVPDHLPAGRSRRGRGLCRSLNVDADLERRFTRRQAAESERTAAGEGETTGRV
jgi:hypothetical protein